MGSEMCIRDRKYCSYLAEMARFLALARDDGSLFVRSDTVYKLEGVKERIIFLTFLIRRSPQHAVGRQFDVQPFPTIAEVAADH